MGAGNRLYVFQRERDKNLRVIISSKWNGNRDANRIRGCESFPFYIDKGVYRIRARV